MSATFLIEDTFVITGRGLVVRGQILDGTLQVGSKMILPDDSGGNQIERITGVILGHGAKDGNKRGDIGLLVGELSESEIPLMRRRLQNGDELKVEDSEPSYNVQQ